MYNNPFYTPGYNMTMSTPNLIRGIPSSAMLNTTRNTSGLLSRLGTSLSGIKKINWSGLINNTSKTLGIINQTIPMVRQVGPIVNNMRSMLRVASIFKDETDTKRPQNTNNINYNTINQNNNIYTPSTNNKKKQLTTNQSIKPTTTQTKEYDESPTFFINT